MLFMEPTSKLKTNKREKTSYFSMWWSVYSILGFGGFFH